MTQLRRNLIANYLGQGCSAVMGFAFIPLYIQYVGIEAYGLIGVFAVMQAWLTLLDMGMTPTLNREMARFVAGAYSIQSIRDLLRSLEFVCFGLAAVVGLGVWAASGFLAGEWLKSEQLSTGVVADSLSVIAIVLALRFCEGIYRGSLFGLQRQVWYNVVNAALALVRHGGAVLVLAWISPTIKAFFVWQAMTSALTLVVFAGSVHRALPKPPAPARFSSAALLGIGNFASGMVGITFLALLLTQVDKLLLSHLLSLELFGYYTLAASVAGVLYVAISPVTQAVYPRMVELFTSKDQIALVTVYHEASQLVTVMTAPVAVLISVFAGEVLFLWSGDANLAQKTAPILSALVVGTFLNALMWMPYSCQLAHGWTSLTLKINAVAVAILIPAIIWVVPRYGPLGAAWIWVALNAGYIVITIKLMHRRLIPHEKWRWYLADVLLPIVGAAGVIIPAKVFKSTSYQSQTYWLLFFVLIGSLALIASVGLANRLRPQLLKIAKRSIGWRYC